MDTRQTAQLLSPEPYKNDDDLTEAQKAFEHLESIIRPVSDIDEEMEKDEYFKEKYGL